jgi:hypothetical protein
MAPKAIILGVGPGSRELLSDRARTVRLGDLCISSRLEAELHWLLVIAVQSAGRVRGGRHADTFFTS